MVDRFCYYVRVRYHECDAQKVVFNARYAEYVDLAVSEFIRILGYGQALVQGVIDYQLVKQTIEWKRPARFDQVLEMAVSTVRLGNTSFTVQVEFRIADNTMPIAVAETVYVLVDHKTLEKRSLPEDLRAALERGAPGLVTDHAGYLTGR
jgi:acyl-CoA thioester hydrolase